MIRRLAAFAVLLSVLWSLAPCACDMPAPWGDGPSVVEADSADSDATPCPPLCSCFRCPAQGVVLPDPPAPPPALPVDVPVTERVTSLFERGPPDAPAGRVFHPPRPA